MSEAGYAIPSRAVEVFQQCLGPGKENARILDAACGTGKIGQLLKDRGYTNVDGLDVSEGLMEIAKSKGVYKKMYNAWLSPDVTLPFNDGEYDAIICIGSVHPSHIKPGAFDQMTRVVKKGESWWIILLYGFFVD